MSDRPENQPRETHAKVLLTLDCNNACIFCYNRRQKGRRPPLDEAAANACIDEGAARGCTHLNLIGGEVTTLPFFLRLLERAGRLYPEISVNTNGRAFADRAFAEAAAAAGLNFVDVSLHGSRAEIHDRLTGSPGSFSETAVGLASLAAIRDAGRKLHLSVTTIVLAGNLADLPDLGGLLVATGIRSWRLKYPHGALGGDGELAANDYLLRYSGALPQLARVIRQNEGRLSIVTHDIPLCLLGDLARHSSDALDLHDVFLMDGRAAETVRVSGHWGRTSPVCEGCAAAGACCGLSPAYVRKHGDGELRPLTEDEFGRLLRPAGESGRNSDPERVRRLRAVLAGRIEAVAARLERRGKSDQAARLRAVARRPSG